MVGCRKRRNIGGSGLLGYPQRAVAKPQEEEDARTRRIQNKGRSSSSSSSDDENSSSDESSSSDDNGISFQKQKVLRKAIIVKKAIGLASTSESLEEESSSEEEQKPKGVEALIKIENPNLAAVRYKKAPLLSEIGNRSSKPELTGRQRKELEEQNYRKLHEAGQTEEAIKDLARLSIIRRQREEAAQNREEEEKAKKEEAKARKESDEKALNALMSILVISFFSKIN